MRVAVFGDVGGHFGPFSQALRDLELDLETFAIPDDLVVVQVGDLIDRGPDTARCVALADGFLQTSPQRWIQLFGNHEGNRLGGPRFWDESLDPASEATIQRWWSTRTGRLAIGLRSRRHGELLVTHGGLVAPLWQMLGRPDLGGAVARLNAWVGTEPDLAFAAGGLLGRGGIPGPAWPDAATELYGSWAESGHVPFGQVHGHSSIGDWSRSKIRRNAPRWLRKAATIDTDRRHEQVTIGGRPFIGIDPVFGTNTSVQAMSPLLVDGEVVD